MPRARAGQTAITDANIFAAVQECKQESGSEDQWGRWDSTFDCPASQATYGPIEDWDVGAVTSLNKHGSGCTESSAVRCGCASPVRCSCA